PRAVPLAARRLGPAAHELASRRLVVASRSDRGELRGRLQAGRAVFANVARGPAQDASLGFGRHGLAAAGRRACVGGGRKLLGGAGRQQAALPAAPRRPVGAGRRRGARMTAPIYIEVFPLLVPKMTGIGRFSARLVQALNQWAPLRLTTFLDPRTARVHRLGTDLARGQEIDIPIGQLADAGEDLPSWARDVCRRPKRPFDAQAALQNTGIYLWARPDERHFGRELTIFYDFTPLIVSWSHTAGLCEAFHRQIAAARNCEQVLAISHSTRADAAWLSPVPEEDIVVAYPGPSQCLDRHAHREPVARSKHAILVVGTREPR